MKFLNNMDNKKVRNRVGNSKWAWYPFPPTNTYKVWFEFQRFEQIEYNILTRLYGNSKI